jgi:hypothetical protein
MQVTIGIYSLRGIVRAATDAAHLGVAFEVACPYPKGDIARFAFHKAYFEALNKMLESA